MIGKSGISKERIKKLIRLVAAGAKYPLEMAKQAILAYT